MIPEKASEKVTNLPRRKIRYKGWITGGVKSGGATSLPTGVGSYFGSLFLPGTHLALTEVVN